MLFTKLQNTLLCWTPCIRQDLHSNPSHIQSLLLTTLLLLLHTWYIIAQAQTLSANLYSVTSIDKTEPKETLKPPCLLLTSQERIAKRKYFTAIRYLWTMMGYFNCVVGMYHTGMAISGMVTVEDTTFKGSNCICCFAS